MKMYCTNLHWKGVIKKKHFFKTYFKADSGLGGSNFCPPNTEIQYLSLQADVSRPFNMFNVPGSHHEEVSTNRDTFFVLLFSNQGGQVLIFIFSRGGGSVEPSMYLSMLLDLSLLSFNQSTSP